MVSKAANILKLIDLSLNRWLDKRMLAYVCDIKQNNQKIIYLINYAT
jgi:hypothetical protein